jgi:glycosyltransferase involved in cell wall biosynthesis
MRILQVHNSYQRRGGEDQVFAAEYELLKSHGHQVVQYVKHNDTIHGMSRIGVGLRTIWNSGTYQELRTLIRQESPDIVHAHNTFPLISPALYYAAATERVPVVQTLHNYRLLCPAATFFRNGRVCEKCMHRRVPYPSVLRGCYRNTRTGTTALASALVVHRVAGTWKTKVTAYIALTNFAKAKFIEGGLPAERIAVKPNCLTADPAIGPGKGGYAFFAGRLTEEKGVCTMLNAWARLGSTIPLKIAGDGPLADSIKRQTAVLPGIHWLGNCDRTMLTQLYHDAAFTVFPSQCYESLPLTIIESLACGTPVIASALGSMNEIIIDGVNGFRFKPGDDTDLADRIRYVLGQPERLQAMRQSSRMFYEKNYTPKRNYDLLIQIYESAIQNGRPLLT